MFPLAANDVVFGVVIALVAIGGFVGGIATAVRGRSRGGGTFWMARGQTDSAPVSGPGTRAEDRHELDPQPGEDA